MSIRIAAAQYPITEHKSFENWTSHIRNWVKDAAGQGSHLLLFPEYGSMELVSIFEDNIRLDIHLQVSALNSIVDNFCSVFEKLAVEFNVFIVAPSIPVLLQEKPVNRVFVFSPKGLAGHQDKLFMTRFENEEWGVTSGEPELALFQTEWGNFGIQVCYDVEFGIGSQLLASAGAHLILAPSCTETIRGATRVHIGARARAMENQTYTVVSQTVGNALWSPAVDINYGFAAFYSTPDKDLPEEGIISAGSPQDEKWLIQDLDLNLLTNVRANGQVFNFKDMQRIQTRIVNSEITIKQVTL